MIRLCTLGIILLLGLSPLAAAPAPLSQPNAKKIAAPAAKPPAAKPPTVTNPQDGKPADKGGAPVQNDSASKTPTITRIFVGSASNIGAEGLPVHLGDWLTLEITQLDELRQKAMPSKKPLQVFFNGMPLAGVAPFYFEKDGHPTRVRFEVARTEDPASKDTWAALLGRPGTEWRKAQVSVGVAGCAEGCSDMTDAFPIDLVVVRPLWLFLYLVGLAIFAWLLVWLAKRTSLLRDGGINSPWSLGRSQMAWWFFIVVASFLLIWMITGSYSSLSNSVLALIGISAGTALLGAVMDDNKKVQIAKRAALVAEQGQLHTAGLALLPGDPTIQLNAQRNQEINAQLAQLPRMQQPSGFWNDLLSDENGVSFHRFQIIVWTLVLTVIFVYRVMVHLTMPDFDAQLLGLMGISSGTYLGFKFPEKQA
jgi:hypothetical protein